MLSFRRVSRFRTDLIEVNGVSGDIIDILAGLVFPIVADHCRCHEFVVSICRDGGSDEAVSTDRARRPVCWLEDVEGLRARQLARRALEQLCENRRNVRLRISLVTTVDMTILSCSFSGDAIIVHNIS